MLIFIEFKLRFITHVYVGTTAVATVDSKRSGFPSIFHKDCEVLY